MGPKYPDRIRKLARQQIETSLTPLIDKAISVWAETLEGKNKKELRYKAAKDLIERIIGKPKQDIGIESEDLKIEIVSYAKKK
ncbi:hypothetical protein J7K91_01860 [bacterium]|nr:hypothetical protein [bacterium]